jgi:hypothetical protein
MLDLTDREKLDELLLSLRKADHTIWTKSRQLALAEHSGASELLAAADDLALTAAHIRDFLFGQLDPRPDLPVNEREVTPYMMEMGAVWDAYHAAVGHLSKGYLPDALEQTIGIMQAAGRALVEISSIVLREEE